MNLSTFTAKHFREIYFGGNWTGSCFKNVMADITWQEAITQIHSCNTIATLFFHSGYYYTSALLDVLNGRELTAKDELSFAHPPISSQKDWEELMNTTWMAAENTAQLIEKLPPSIFEENFVLEKYGTYHRNIYGTIEHAHYHLGQMVIIKKLLRTGSI